MWDIFSGHVFDKEVLSKILKTVELQQPRIKPPS